MTIHTMTKYGPTQAANMLGVTVDTLRRWESEGRIQPATRTAGGHRRYTDADIAAIRDAAVDSKDN